MLLLMRIRQANGAIVQSTFENLWLHDFFLRTTVPLAWRKLGTRPKGILVSVSAFLGNKQAQWDFLLVHVHLQKCQSN